MLTSSKRRLFDFIINQKDELLSEWENKILISADDPFKDKIAQNRDIIFEMILNMFDKSEDELETYFQKIAVMVGKERVRANSNIGDFVYNVNIGRSVILKNVNKMDEEWSTVQSVIDDINHFFDKFLYYAVSLYTEAKDKIIEEKTQFIDSTHKDRLTLLGQMTSSFIHEFRNPLTSVQGFIQLLKAEHPNMKYLDIIASELEQLNFRISQFLLLSKKELIGKEKSNFSLNDLVEEVLTFLYPSILDGKVKIIKEVEEDIILFGYADEIRQVFINLIFNAIDVLSQYRNDPVIIIKSVLMPNHYIQLKVSNNGPMIPISLQKTIFEPFVTTKTLGTGLGLFVCKEIIEKHKGNLSCNSTQEKTDFIINLPVATLSKNE